MDLVQGFPGHLKKPLCLPGGFPFQHLHQGPDPRRLVLEAVEPLPARSLGEGLLQEKEKPLLQSPRLQAQGPLGALDQEGGLGQGLGVEEEVPFPPPAG